MVTVEVGPPKEIFVVHEKFLCQKSQYFAKAMSGSFLESVKRFVQLPDVSPTLFRIFINWLYYGKLCYAGEDDEKTGMNLQNLVIQPEEIGLIPTRSSDSIRKSKVEDDENVLPRAPIARRSSHPRPTTKPIVCLERLIPTSLRTAYWTEMILQPGLLMH